MPLLIALLLSAGPVQGDVHHAGVAKPVAQPVRRDVKVCGESQPDESLLLGAKGGVQNAVVYVKNPPPAGPKTPPRERTLDQQGCRYIPHVTAAQVGDSLVALNSDNLLHNVRGTRPDGKTPFNVAMPLKGMKRAFSLSEPGLIQTGCDAGHTWMVAYVQVFPHPYFAVTDAEGKFKLPPLPAGSYTLGVWHEKLGEKTQTVKVTERGASVKLTL
ncbi:MAG: hypothetical protein ACT4TC_19120 [Myxococcaceae bacterium]